MLQKRVRGYPPDCYDKVKPTSLSAPHLSIGRVTGVTEICVHWFSRLYTSAYDPSLSPLKVPDMILCGLSLLDSKIVRLSLYKGRSDDDRTFNVDGSPSCLYRLRTYPDGTPYILLGALLKIGHCSPLY